MPIDRAGPGSRVWFVRLESPVGRWLVFAIVLGAAAAAAWSVLRPGVADWLGRGTAERADLERVVALDPGNPIAHTRLGLALAESVDADDLARARRHLETALRMQPAQGFAWLRLAQVSDRAGDRDRARRALGAAILRDPHNVTLRWDAATLLLQWGDGGAALEHLRYVVAVDPQQRHVAFQLLRALAGSGQTVDTLLPAEPDALTNILQAGLREGDVALARAAWERRVSLAPPLPEYVNRSYLNLLVRRGEGEAAGRAWAMVAPAIGSANSGNEVWNGGFEGEPFVGWGLGWRNVRVWGVQVQVDRAVAARGNQSLRLTFNSFPNLEFSGVYQPAPVHPNRRYRLEAQVRAAEFTTRSGLKLQVVVPGEVPADDKVIAETSAVTGTTSGWVQLTARVDIPAGVSLVRVVLRRVKAIEPEGNLGGKVWVDEVALVPLRDAA